MFSFILRPTLRILAIAAVVSAPVLAQERAPLVLTSAKISLAGTSNIHDYTAATSKVRVVRVQLAGADSDVLAAAVKPGVLQAFEIAIPAASLHSTKDGLDKNMHKALKVKEHADIVFKLSRLESTAKGLRAVGGLQIAGVTKEIGIDLTTVTKGSTLVVTGSVPLVMTDFGVEPPKAMMGMIKTDPKVTVSFEAVLSGPLS